jgi:hypothetical protein
VPIQAASEKEIARAKEALQKLCDQMTNFQGVFRTNAECIGWLLKLMQARDGESQQSVDAISAVRNSCVSNTAFVDQTRRYVARILPERKLRSRGLQTHIDIAAPALQADLDNLLTSVVREQNEEQTKLLTAVLDQSEGRVLQDITAMRLDISADNALPFLQLSTKLDGLSRQLAELSQTRSLSLHQAPPLPPSQCGLLNTGHLDAHDASAYIGTHNAGEAMCLDDSEEMFRGEWRHSSSMYTPTLGTSGTFHEMYGNDPQPSGNGAEGMMCDEAANGFFTDDIWDRNIATVALSTLEPLASTPIFSTFPTETSTDTHMHSAMKENHAPPVGLVVNPNSRRWVRASKEQTPERSKENHAPNSPTSPAHALCATVHNKQPRALNSPTDRRLSTLETPYKELSNFTGDNGVREQLPAAAIQKTASLRVKPVSLAQLVGNYHWDDKFNAGAHSLLQRLPARPALHSYASTEMPSSSKHASTAKPSSSKPSSSKPSSSKPSSSKPSSSKQTCTAMPSSSSTRAESTRAPQCLAAESSSSRLKSLKDTSAFIVDQLFAFIDIEWNDGREIVQYAYIVVRGDGTVVRKVKLLSVRPRNVNMQLRVTKLTVEQLQAGKPLRECRDEIEVAFCHSGTPVGWSFAHDVTITNNDLRTEGMEPLLGNGVCALALARKIFRHTGRTTKNFAQKEVGIALGITDAMLEDHFADHDAVLGSRIFAKLFRIADNELGVVTEDELTNLLVTMTCCRRVSVPPETLATNGLRPRTKRRILISKKARTRKRPERAVQRARKSRQPVKTVKQRHAIWPEQRRRQLSRKRTRKGSTWPTHSARKTSASS